MARASIRATPDERERALPGDSWIPQPSSTVTHAITIRAPAERVWPWLAQAGGGRAGWYSIDRLDNADVPSASAILDDEQSVREGDLFPTYRSFNEPGWVKIAWTLEAEPLSSSQTRFRTETRAFATDADARRRFRRYWLLVGRGVVIIRYAMLSAVRREVERVTSARRAGSP